MEVEGDDAADCFEVDPGLFSTRGGVEDSPDFVSYSGLILFYERQEEK